MEDVMAIRIGSSAFQRSPWSVQQYSIDGGSWWGSSNRSTMLHAFSVQQYLQDAVDVSRVMKAAAVQT